MRRMSICCLSLATLSLGYCAVTQAQDKLNEQTPSTAVVGLTSGARAEFRAEVIMVSAAAKRKPFKH
jgi:hypothetical protein